MLNYEHGNDDPMASVGNKNVIVLSVPNDVPVVDHAELMLKVSIDYDACETIKDREGEAEAPDNESVSSVYSEEPSEVTQVSASVMHVSEDDHKHGGGNDKLMNEEGDKNISLLSVPNGATLADHYGLMLEDFKDQRELDCLNLYW